MTTLISDLKYEELNIQLKVKSTKLDFSKNVQGANCKQGFSVSSWITKSPSQNILSQVARDQLTPREQQLSIDA